MFDKIKESINGILYPLQRQLSDKEMFALLLPLWDSTYFIPTQPMAIPPLLADTSYDSNMNEEMPNCLSPIRDPSITRSNSIWEDWKENTYTELVNHCSDFHQYYTLEGGKKSYSMKSPLTQLTKKVTNSKTFLDACSPERGLQLFNTIG